MSANRSTRLRHYNSIVNKNMQVSSCQNVLKIGKEMLKRTVHCSVVPVTATTRRLCRWDAREGTRIYYR